MFQISVAGDIRFYGLLKTIGTTPRQLSRMIRMQAWILSLVGIPVGLLLGWLLGGVLSPLIAPRLHGVTTTVSANPVIFVGAAIFVLFTVFISCRRPGRMAARVSPMEAVRYTEGRISGAKSIRNEKGVSLLSMARANLGRSRSKTIVTVLSLSLAVVLLTMTVTFTRGFDMDKYISYFMASDFIVANADQFQTGGEIFNSDIAVSEEVISAIENQDGSISGGRIYGRVSVVQEFVTEEYYRKNHGKWNTPEQLDSMIPFMECNEEGKLADVAQLYGMEPFALEHLTVLAGDISKLNDPDGNYIAAVYSEDDYGDLVEDSHWATLGETITLRYVQQFEYYNPVTGEIYGSPQDVPEDAAFSQRAVEYRDVTYTVAALVAVPNPMSYRYYGSDEFVMGSQTFLRDTGTDSIMYYAFDTKDSAANAAMESFLQNYTEEINPQLDYESKSLYAAEFENVRHMFQMLGGALSFIVGLVGVLNFFNAILTGISARRRELAVLQAIGMTSGQLRTMLALEGLFYTAGATIFALLLVVLSAPFMKSVLNGIIWFFTYHFTLWPIALVFPFFAVLGILLPIWSCHMAQKHSVVERLRQE
ncbi:MAG: FtsX-like permease family protein [Eubacteriales bacterium]